MLRHAAALACLSAVATSFPLSTTTTTSTGVDTDADAALAVSSDFDDDDIEILWEDLHFSLPPKSWTDDAIDRAYNIIDSYATIGVDLFQFFSECDLYASDDGFWSMPWSWESVLWKGPAGPLQCSVSLTPSLSPYKTYPLQAEPLIRCHNNRQRFRCTL